MYVPKIITYEIINGKANLVEFDAISLKYPNTASYLLKNKKRLEGREQGKMNGKKWYGYIYLKNMGRQNTRKICVPRLVEELLAAYDSHENFFLDNVDVCGVGLNSNYQEYGLPYVLCLLNSKTLGWF